MGGTGASAPVFRVTAPCECGEGQNRTADTAIFSRVLCQLSYLASTAEDSNGLC
jgi:hypothetical protein